MRAALALALIGCNAPAVGPDMPWLHGLADATVTTASRPDVVERMPAPSPDEACATPDVGLALATADQTILASYTRGVVVLDRENAVIASTPGWPCGGSADDVDALATGRAYGEWTIALAATTGGHREAETWLALFRVGFAGRLDPVFTGVVEERHGDETVRGDVYLLPNALLYRRPGGKLTLWIWDAAARAYLFRGTLGPVDEAPPDVDEEHRPPIA